jgi:hypothetical protein
MQRQYKEKTAPRKRASGRWRGQSRIREHEGTSFDWISTSGSVGVGGGLRVILRKRGNSKCKAHAKEECQG